MSPRRLLRIALHLLLAAGFVLPGIVAPAQATAQALAAASASAAADATGMAHSPCDRMTVPMPMPGKAPAKLPAGAHQGCDLAACLGAGCLPTLPHLAAYVPEHVPPIAWDQPVPPSQRADTPLRPPIA